MTRAIGADQVDQRAPPDRDICRVAAVELRSRGLTVADIADALGLSASAVRQLLGETQSPK